MMTMAELPVPPDAIFGMLLAREGGATLDQMAHVYGMGRNSIVTLMDMARRGECPRIEASTGDVRVPMRQGKGTIGHGPVAADHEEVLVQRWMRRIARHLSRHGWIENAKVHELIGDAAGMVVSEAIRMLTHQCKSLGIQIHIDRTHGGMASLRYTVDEPSRDRLAGLIASGWKIEVAR